MLTVKRFGSPLSVAPIRISPPNPCPVRAVEIRCTKWIVKWPPRSSGSLDTAFRRPSADSGDQVRLRYDCALAWISCVKQSMEAAHLLWHHLWAIKNIIVNICGNFKSITFFFLSSIEWDFWEKLQEVSYLLQNSRFPCWVSYRPCLVVPNEKEGGPSVQDLEKQVLISANLRRNHFNFVIAQSLNRRKSQNTCLPPRSDRRVLANSSVDPYTKLASRMEVILFIWVLGPKVHPERWPAADRMNSRQWRLNLK